MPDKESRPVGGKGICVSRKEEQKKMTCGKGELVGLV